MKRDFLAITDFSAGEVRETFDLAMDLKNKLRRGEPHHLLEGQTLAMIFQKPSARTRVSFEVGMYQLGGHALYLSPADIGLGKRETAADVARVFSRYCDGIMARLFGHDLIEKLAAFSAVPVINGLTDLLHPCQVMGDMLTILEHRRNLDDLQVTYVGDGNNMAHSWMNMASRIPMHLHIACPEGYDPNKKLVQAANKSSFSTVKIFRDPMEAVKGSDVIYTDVWASMGQEKEAKIRKKAFRGYQVDQAMVNQARSGVLVMHCLPAHRGEEIAEEVLEGPNAIVFDEAENRLHIQKAIMVKLMQR